MVDLLSFSSEERGFESVGGDDVLFDAGVETDATGESGRVTLEVRESGGKFYPQRIKRDEDGRVISKRTLGRARQSREAAETAIERHVENETAPGFGGFEIGDFVIDKEQDLRLAERSHLSRSDKARIADRSKRAAVTTDASRYAKSPGSFDYPGVDTPTQDPNVLPKDFKRGGRPETTDVDERQTSSDEPSGFDAFPEAEAGSSLAESFELEMAGRDVPASPEEVSRGVGAVSPQAIGGFNPSRQRETDPIGSEPVFGHQDESKADEGDRLFKEMAAQDNRASGLFEARENERVAELFEESDEDSLFQFARATRSKKRRMGGLMDTETAALQVKEGDSLL